MFFNSEEHQIFLYLTDLKSNSFCTAEKAAQLEQIIEANICENMESIMYVAIEGMEHNQELGVYEIKR